MKPKNRVMCPDCGKQKMLFETEKKAETFLKFNMDEVNPDGTREMRVYYCPACCGYHITSKEYRPSYEGRTERLINRFHNDKKSLFDQLVGENPKTIEDVNKFLRSKTGYSPHELSEARKKYKKYKGLK
jgi:hypothetical protein